MSRDMNQLVDGFQIPARKLRSDLLRHDKHDLRVFFTRRNPWIQARLWRQSRATPEIHRAAQMLSTQGAPFLREILTEVGPCSGRWATNALPGQSWHQWGEAMDCFVYESSRAIWTRKHPGYEAYATRAREMGLVAGYFWQRPDAVHVQFRADKVLSQYSWAEIDAAMRDQYAEGEPNE